MNKRILRLVLIYTALFLPLTIGIDFTLSLMAYAFFIVTIAIFVGISMVTQRKLQNKKAFFYPFVIYAIIDLGFFINGVFINPDEFGFGMVLSLFLIAATVATIPFYFALNPKSKKQE